MANELMVISALIGDRTYRIKIHPGDEEVVRKTLKSINEKIIEFKTQFAGKDMQDYTAMVLLWFATRQQEKTGDPDPEGKWAAGLEGIEKMLDRQLGT